MEAQLLTAQDTLADWPIAHSDSYFEAFDGFDILPAPARGSMGKFEAASNLVEYIRAKSKREYESMFDADYIMGTRSFPIIAQVICTPLREEQAAKNFNTTVLAERIGSALSVVGISSRAQLTSIREISRLKDGWDGPGSHAPSQAVKDDVLKLANFFPPNCREPSAEVDPDDGSVVLRWQNEHGMFSLTFCGRKTVTGYLMNAQKRPAWKLALSDFRSIYSRLNDESVLQVISK